jgi:hypothetical protein
LTVATASYDRAVRLYHTHQGTPHDTYTNRRMQRVLSLSHTADSYYLLSGSDEGVLRVWRTRADRRPGPAPSARMASALQYADALKARFKHAPEIKRIGAHRHLPGWMKREARKERAHAEGVKRRGENVERHGGKVDIQGVRSVVVKETDY